MVRKRIGGLIGAAVLAVIAVSCAQSDPGITTAVKGKLAADDTVKAYRIDVDTREGVVTLNGKVDTEDARKRAVELARATDGVRDVVDRLTVERGVTPTTGVDDPAQSKASEAARSAGEKADRAGEKAGDAATRAGEATKDAAGRATEATKDAAITAAVKTKFLADNDIAGLSINVDTTNNIVTLSGTVKSDAEKKRAVQLARDTEGVKSVVDKLKVAPR
jgi:hyperosmotically inducible protein